MRRVTFPVACLVMIGFACQARADDAALQTAVDQMFEIGWSGSYKTQKPVDDQFQKIQQIKPGDVRAVYAYAIVQIKQRRYKDAAQLLKHLVEYKQDHMLGWKAKAWLSMFTKEYSQSLVELERISKMIPDKESSVEEKIANLETSQFLGRLVGYLEGPQQGAVSELRLKTYKEGILARLPQHHQRAFSEANEKVIDSFAEMSGEKDKVEEQANEDAEQARAQKLSELEQDRAETEKRLAELGPEAKKLESEMREELKSIADEDKPLLEAFNRLDLQRIGIQREASIYTSDILRLQGQLGRSEDPTTQALIAEQLQQRTLLANQYRGQIQQVEFQMAKVDAQRANVVQRYRQTEAAFASQLKKLGLELKSIKKQEKIFNTQEKLANKPSSADLRRVRTLATKAKALSTYQDFNYEMERQRILDMFE